MSETAANIFAAMPPADLLARERETAFIRRRLIQLGDESPMDIHHARDTTFRKWKKRIANAKTGDWTIAIVGNVERWCHRPHGQ